MEGVIGWIQQSIDSNQMIAPVLFIAFHIIRPFLFIPVAFICITGGLLFGMTYGVVYSLIGVTLSSLLFYLVVQQTPSLFKRFERLREKMFGRHSQLNMPQVVLLRITPFIHFHLISLILIEMTRNFKEYARMSIISNLPLAFVYTTFGQWFQSLGIVHLILFLSLILILMYLIRRKEIILKWEDFFTVERTEN
ncbi:MULTISPECIES: TVP38/TMEM64 family protein [Allobacillus]|uniref:TVP38/TMEM64 family membrane protein n=1 Tax=Allobacillus halotolerans TaxID=570278 RepID=A0ABS6GMP8_9BACI|nr:MULTISPECIES: VTT domain-containing protein [Allobacillus]MBU6080178.1 VTT domain-containing protein [Allobacillus halotolerans]TSJ68388.1 TVP38/TMEM64 family protein [Allobacillus sp. SKP2-8]